MPSLAAGREAGELGGHAAPAALHDPPAPALQRAEGSCGVHLHHVRGVRTASPQGGGISEPSSLFSEAGGTRRDGRAPLAHPRGPRPRLSEAEGPRLAAHGGVPTQDACSGLRARGTFWKVNLKFSNGNSVQKIVMGSPPLGSGSSFLTEGTDPPSPPTPWGATHTRLAPSPSWASLAGV